MVPVAKGILEKEYGWGGSNNLTSTCGNHFSSFPRIPISTMRYWNPASSQFPGQAKFYLPLTMLIRDSTARFNGFLELTMFVIHFLSS